MLINSGQQLDNVTQIIDYLESSFITHQQTLKFALNYQKPQFIYEIIEENDDDIEEAMLNKTKKDSVKSYA